jgi:hypothetical protein
LAILFGNAVELSKSCCVLLQSKEIMAFPLPLALGCSRELAEGSREVGSCVVESSNSHHYIPCPLLFMASLEYNTVPYRRLVVS